MMERQKQLYLKTIHNESEVEDEEEYEVPERFYEMYTGMNELFWSGYNEPKRYICFITRATQVRKGLGHIRDNIIDKAQVNEYYSDPLLESGGILPEPEVVLKLRTRADMPPIPISKYAK